VLTGEGASFKGVSAPTNPFAVGAPGWGAVELVARYGALDIDDASFPLYAAPTTAASDARSAALGINWYLNSSLKFVFNYTLAEFSGGAAQSDRPDEKTFFTRTQVSF
jgi:phosphate-selective porin OprO and OprP